MPSLPTLAYYLWTWKSMEIFYRAETSSNFAICKAVVKKKTKDSILDLTISGEKHDIGIKIKDIYRYVAFLTHCLTR